MDGTDFSAWLSNLARAAGYDPEPRRGGRARLAKATGLNATHVGRILDGITKPDIDTMKRFVAAFNEAGVKVTILDMLIHSGDIEPDDLPSGGTPTPEVHEIDLWSLAGHFNIPESQRHLFGRLVQSVAEQLTDDQKAASVSQHASQTGGKSSAEG